MGIEYYLVKPEKKEVLHLGRHFTCPYGIIDRKYINKAHYMEYYCFDDFLWDFLKEGDNSSYFDDLKLEDIKEALCKVYEWCSDDKIYFDNDCNDKAEWTDWPETSSLSDIIKDIIKPKTLSEDFKNYLEEVQATVFRDPSFDSAIVGVTSDDRAVYDYDLMVEDLSDQDNMSLWEAQEFIEYNTIRALPYMPKSPVILNRKENWG